MSSKMEKVDRPTFESVWAMIQELTASQQKWQERHELLKQEETLQRKKEQEERQQEWQAQQEKRDREWRESQRQWKEQQAAWEKEQNIWQKSREKLEREEVLQRINSKKRFDEQLDRNNEEMGRLSRRFGEMIEHIVAPNLYQKFNALGFSFEKPENTDAMRRKLRDSRKKVYAEIDLVLESASLLMAVEVKAKPDIFDVDDHADRIKLFCQHLQKTGDTRIIIGAFAGAIVSKDVRKYAIKKGFYVLEQSGDTVHIVNPADFKPRQWCHSGAE